MESHRTAPRLTPLLRRTGIVLLIVAAMATVAWLEVALCPMAVILHVPCPGCGMTRATLAALHGDFATTYRYHPLALLMVPLLGAYAAAHAVSYIRHGVSQVDTFVTGKWIDRGILLLLIAMVVVWIARFFGAFGGPAPV